MVLCCVHSAVASSSLLEFHMIFGPSLLSLELGEVLQEVAARTAQWVRARAVLSVLALVSVAVVVSECLIGGAHYAVHTLCSFGFGLSVSIRVPTRRTSYSSARGDAWQRTWMALRLN